MSSLVRVSNLRKRFGSIEAVRGISFDVEEGTAVGLLGPNGAGKTTTLLMLLGAIDPDEGTIEICGKHLPGQRSAAMEHVGFAAGYLPMPDRLTVDETLEFFAQLHGLSRPAPDVRRVLQRFDVTHLAKKPIDTLSSGQRTIVGIAKAVIHRPDFIVLDEPTASLDPDVADRVREAIADLNQEDGTTLLITSHDMDEVERLCSRVLFVQHGQIVANDSPAKLKEEFGQSDLEGVFLHVARRTKEQQ